MRHRRPLPFVGTLLCAALVITGCGSSPTSGAADGPTNRTAGSSDDPSQFARYLALTGSSREDTLLADARRQGGVLDVYTSNTDIDKLVAGFTKAYPGIKVNTFRANSETVLQRILQESQANKIANDVVDTNDFELDVLSEQGTLARYRGPAIKALRPQASFPDWTASRYNAFVVGWNTKLVPAGEEPKSFEDLASPKWKGKLAMEVSDWDWYASLTTYLTDRKGMSPDAAQQLLERIAANAKVVKGHTVQGELLSAGQFSVALSVYSHTVDKAAADGAPVTWRPAVQPVILRPNGVALMRRARHPAAAVLWVDWVLGPGQAVIAESKRIPAATSVAGFSDPIPAGTEVFDVPQQIISKSNKTWSSRYDALLRGVPKVG